jgi:hypothetical protein
MSFPGRSFRPHTSEPVIAIQGANLVHWTRFDLAQCSLAGTKVASARDRLGTNNVSQASDIRRPIWTAAGGQNSRAFADFDATAIDALALPSGFTGWSAGDGVYVWAVAKWDLLGGYTMTSNYTPTGASYDEGATVRKNNVNACQFFVKLGGGVGIQSVATAPNSIGSTGTYYIEGWIDPSAGQIKCAINGGAAATTAVTNFGLASPIGRVSMGKRADIEADYFDGRLYECGAARAWSPAAQNGMRQYFAGYYGL